MKIFETLGSLEDEEKLYTCDTIQYEVKMLIVPQWLDQISTEKTMPVLIILLDAFLIKRPHLLVLIFS